MEISVKNVCITKTKYLCFVLCAAVLLGGCAEKPSDASPQETLPPQKPLSPPKTEPAESSKPAVSEGERERAPEDEAEVLQVQDPYLQIFSPESIAGFISRIVVMGRITDSTLPSSSASGISSLTYRIVELPSIAGEIAFDREIGTFLLDMNAETISGLKTLRVTATASNGRSVSRDLRFIDIRPKPFLTTIGITQLESAMKRPEFPEDTSGPSGDLSVSSGDLFVSSVEVASAKTSSARSPESRLEDSKIPFITILSPEPMSSWMSKVVVKGRVGNSVADGASEILSLSYRVSTHPFGASTHPFGASTLPSLSNEIPFERESGNFSFELDPAAFTGMTELQVAAENVRGKVATANLRLLFSGERPYVSITAPEDGAFYRSQLTVIGRVSNSEDDIESSSRVKSLSFRLVNWDVPKEIDFSNKSGVFDFDLDVEGLSGKQVVLLLAEDLDGNRSVTALTLMDGNVKPVLTITSPQDRSEYGAGVFVTGSVGLSSKGEALKEAIKSLSYRVVSAETFDLQSSPRGGVVDFDNDGAFRFLLSTEDLSGPQLVSVSAEVWNGNKTTSKVTIVKGASAIPSFTVTPGNERVVLEWDPVPQTEKYDLYFSKGASSSPERIGQSMERVESPTVLKNLENGVMYSFKLHAKGPPGTEGFWSNTRSIIPLSPATLAPVVTGEYGQIRLTWKDIPGADTYTVLRSGDGGKSYSELHSSVPEAVYMDVTALFGKTYYYKVRLPIAGSIVSDARSGKTIAFPTTRLMHIASNSEPKAIGVAIRRDYAYLACGKEGLKIVDIYDPKSLEVVGTLQTGDARRLTVRDDYVYLADGEKGLKIIDVSNPLDPQIIGTRKTSNANDIVLKGNYAFIADGEKGLKVIDISNPRFPGRIGTVETTRAKALAVKADHVFVADGEGGIKVIDITRPRKPTVISEFATHNASGITIRGDRAYVADGERGVKVLDISNPFSPVQLWSYDADDARKATARGDYLFIADGKAGVKAIDISDPHRPLPFGTYATMEAMDLSLSGQFIYVADSSSFMALQAIIVGRSHKVAGCETDGKASQVFFSEGYAYVADHEKGLKIIDVSDPLSVDGSSITGAIDTNFATDVVTSGKYAYVADGKRGLKVIDISNSWDSDPDTHPILVGAFTTEGRARAIDIRGEILVVVSEGEGFEILDVSDPQRPKLLSYQNTSDAKDACFIEIDSMRVYLCVADGEKGLKIFDISDPAHPLQVGKLESLAVRNVTPFKTPQGEQRLCLICPSGLKIVDMAEPNKPRLLGSFATAFAEDAIVAENHVFLADGYRGLKVIDISNPSLPTTVSICEDVYAVGVAQWQASEIDYALIVDSTGLKVIQILIPEWLKNPENQE